MVLVSTDVVEDLVEFLRQRITEDRVAVAAECEAKWQILDRCWALLDPDFGQRLEPAPQLAWAVLKDLASIYAEHPEFRDEWKGW